MDQDFIFTIIGKLYFDAVSAQQAIETLKNKIIEKDKTIQELKNKEILGNNES